MTYLTNLRALKLCLFIEHMVSWKQNYLIELKMWRAIYGEYEIIAKTIHVKLLLFIYSTISKRRVGTCCPRVLCPEAASKRSLYA